MADAALVLAPLDKLECEVGEALDICGGDPMKALRITLIANAFLEARIDELEAKGIKTDGMRLHGQGPGYSVYIVDPSGNRLELSKD